MGGAKTVGLAFRLYGSFAWPPLPDKADVTKPRDGVVEVHYVPEPGGTQQAVLRFVEKPADSVIPPFDGAAQYPKLSALDDAALAALFHGVRLDAATVKERLLFRGARLIEQYGLEDGAAPVLRLVLARRYTQGNTAFFSEMVIGGAGAAPAFRFNLALPTPVPQGIVGGKPLMALPFSITYPAALPAAVPKGPVEIATFQAGSSARGSISEGGDYPLPAAIKGRVLGSFGFCRSDGGEEFLPVPRSGKKPERANYWLDDNARFRDLTLWRFGEMTAFSEGGLQFGHRVLDGEMPLIADRIGQFKRGEHWDHVRFVTGEGGTRVVFRTGLITGVATSGRDLSVKAGSATLGVRHPDDRKTVIDTEAQRLIVEHEVHYEIGDDELWGVALGAPADASVTVRLGFDSSRTTPKTGIAALLKDASDAARAGRQDLANLTPDQPQSLLPEISGVTNEGARLVLTSTMAATFTTDGALQWGAEQGGPGWAGGAFRLTAWPEDRLIRHGDGSFAEPVPKLLTAVLALPGLGGVGEPITSVAVRLAHDPAPAAQNAMFCQFRLLPSRADGVETVTRLGGLAMTHGTTGTIFADAQGAADYSHVRFGRRLSGPDAVATEMDVRLRLPLIAVEPVGVDVPWGDRSGRLCGDRAGAVHGHKVLFGGARQPGRRGERAGREL